MKYNFLVKIKNYLEKYIPMTFTSLLLFVFVCYLLFIVGKSVIENYKTNKDIDKEEMKLIEMEDDLRSLQNQINYYQTYSFKEKEAREKLGYKASGESVLALPIDTEEEKSADSGLTSPEVLVPNYILWWEYFTKG